MTLFAANQTSYNKRKVDNFNLLEILTTNREDSKPTTFNENMDSDTIVKIIVDSMMVELRKEFERVGLTPQNKIEAS